MSSTRSNGTVQVVTSVERRRRWSPQQKLALVEEVMQTGEPVSVVARRNGVAPSQLFAWRRLMEEGGKSAIGAGGDVVAASEVKALKTKVRELERLLGRKTVENEILKEALEMAREKKLISRMPLPGVETGQ